MEKFKPLIPPTAVLLRTFNEKGNGANLLYCWVAAIFLILLSQIGNSMGSLVSFQRGDIVQRNSGGPRMLIEEIEDAEIGVVRCRWYEDRKKREGSFFTEGLRHFLMTTSASS